MAGKFYLNIQAKRFDRINNTRIPMHSLSGALNTNFRIPNCSYGTYLRMTRFMTRNEQEVEKAFSYAVFNICMNNRDDHTKNFSYLMNKDNESKVSPAYDLTFNPGINGYHQMDVEGEAYKVNREHLINLAKNAGLNISQSEAIIDTIITVAKERVNQLLSGKYRISKETAIEIKKKINENIQLIK